MQVQPWQSGILAGGTRRRSAFDGQAPARGFQLGFTIVELMVTVAVAAVLLMIAVPTFRNVMAVNQLNTAANGIVGAISVARMEAIQRNAGAQFCSNLAANNTTDTLGNGCATNGGAVYALSGGTAVPVRAAPPGLASSVQLSGDITAIRFNGQGRGFKADVMGTPFDSTATGNPVADICSTTLSSDNHRVISMAAGSVITTTTATGACP